MEELLKEYPKALNISEVAEILNISQATVRRHIKNNEIPYVKIGRLVRIPKARLVAYLNQN